MMTFTEGNLLKSDAEALVNTVNTVGVMGKGIALMFKEAFPENFREYEAASKEQRITVGKMFVTRRDQLLGPRWIVNFPTKQHWRNPSKIEWIRSGLEDLKAFIRANEIRSIAIPPLGSGNGGLQWPDVREVIQEVLGDVDADIIVYEPTNKYQNVAKRTGVQKLTPARALVAELVRRYSILGLECTLLEVQKLAYFLERMIVRTGSSNPLDLRFEANKFGPYANRLTHLLDGLDGSYLHCDKRLADAGALDTIWFDEGKKAQVALYLNTEAKQYSDALEQTSDLIDGFESPLGMELLATVDWLLADGVAPDVGSIQSALSDWPGGRKAGERKLALFDKRMIGLAIDRLVTIAA
ncbi:MAG: macro domain-containing protein [Devosia sp.]|uniref:type II toxin-antitoxin system antitoxin DNA ADP-ribosyl glycohydrolase DarG n=1 Tax=Devosia sp. TaxID=1871048 RepID=UPI001AD4F18E|nr:macro domain-containing protein [Devosia sp.]MBN9317610.1 macro domain-containing protein [Devosia sp.]